MTLEKGTHICAPLARFFFFVVRVVEVKAYGSIAAPHGKHMHTFSSCAEQGVDLKSCASRATYKNSENDPRVHK